MKRWRSLAWCTTWVASAGLVVGMGPERALACSPEESEPAYADFGEVIPANQSTNVPLDHPLMIAVNFYSDDVFYEGNISVTNVETGELVDGSASQDHSTLRFFPDKLEPNTTYSLEATIESEGERVPGATGVEHTTTTFTTGEGLLPALTISRALQSNDIEFEEYLAPEYSECDEGECECTPIETVPQMRARVRIPSAEGRYAAGGYDVYVAVFAKGKDELSLRGEAFGRLSAATDGVVEVPQLRWRQPYTPCFQLTYENVAGGGIEGDVLCLQTVLEGDDSAPPASPDAGYPYVPDIASNNEAEESTSVALDPEADDDSSNDERTVAQDDDIRDPTTDDDDTDTEHTEDDATQETDSSHPDSSSDESKEPDGPAKRAVDRNPAQHGCAFRAQGAGSDDATRLGALLLAFALKLRRRSPMRI